MAYLDDMDDLARMVNHNFTSKSRYRGTGNEDIDAFVYYGTFGLVDPKAPIVDAPAISKATGLSYGKALLSASVIGFLTMGAIGWVFDPQDKRRGGVWESEIFQSAWQPIKQGWEMGRESDSPWWL